uniref:Uncharacterized protein n=1 Tax=Picea sitchensis TaxID=3332 RepID=A9NTM8_PICSI|nr:unknown [Picea sitchensis]
MVHGGVLQSSSTRGLPYQSSTSITDKSPKLADCLAWEIRVCKCRQYRAHRWIPRPGERSTSNDSPSGYRNKTCDNSTVRRKMKK